MKHDIELELRRDARSIEEDAPAGMFARVSHRMSGDSAGEVGVQRLRIRTVLVAAVILVVAGGTLWAAFSSRRNGSSVVSTSQPHLVAQRAGPDASRGAARGGLGLFPTGWRSEGIEMAARAGEPLAREWERVKSDSMTLLRGFERQIPRL